MQSPEQAAAVVTASTHAVPQAHCMRACKLTANQRFGRDNQRKRETEGAAEREEKEKEKDKDKGKERERERERLVGSTMQCLQNAAEFEKLPA